MLIVCHSDQLLQSYALGDLANDDAVAVETHLQVCLACSDRLNLLSHKSDSLLAALRQIPSTEVNRIGHGAKAGTESEPDLPLGTILNGYRLQEVLGQGGMGRVYQAAHPRLEQLVALKVMRPGQHTSQRLARFETERQTLALMNHPNIARVFDGGVTAEGRPFLVMELLRGASITQYCDKCCLGIQQRLELFVQVCQAVQHAHQKGIIHRDLKPSNVIVTEYDGKPVPKVIDFGIAKPTEFKDTPRTEVGLIIGTPEYMSPEQVSLSRSDIDTRSDIYALGVMLYELLTGATPFHSKSSNLAMLELFRSIMEDDPPAPSSRLSSAETIVEVATHRSTEPGRLVRRLRGELDWIVLHCLEKEPARRYATASALAEDIERYLKNEPIAAGPPSLGYRLRKFVRRNRAAVWAAALSLLALIGGIIGTSLGLLHASEARLAAEKDRDEKNQALDNLILAQEKITKALKLEKTSRAHAMTALRSLTQYSVERQISQQATLTTADRQFFRNVISVYQKFADIRGDDEESRAIRAEGYQRVGILQSRLGVMKDALASQEQSRDLLNSLVAEYPEKHQYRIMLARSYAHHGIDLMTIGKLSDSEADHQRSVSLGLKLIEEQPRSTEVRLQLIDSHFWLGNLYFTTNQYPKAQQAFQSAFQLGKENLENTPDDSELRIRMAMCHSNLGNVYRKLGKASDAEKSYQSAVGLLNELIREFPDATPYQITLATTQNNIGLLRSDQNNYTEAEAAYRSGLNICMKLAADYPMVPSFRQQLANTHNNLGFALKSLKRYEESEAEQLMAVKLKLKLVKDFPNVVEHQVQLGGSYCNMGHLMVSWEKGDQSLPWYKQAIETLVPIVESEPANQTARQFLVNSLLGRGRQLMRMKRYEESVKDWDRAIALDSSRLTAPINRAKCLARIDPKSAVGEADRLVNAAAPTSQTLYDAASIYSLAAANANEVELKEQLSEKAVTVLKKLGNNGYLRHPERLKRLKADTDFEAIQHRNGYQKMIASWETSVSNEKK